VTESTPLWQTRIAYSFTWKRFQNWCEWSACFHGEFSLWSRNSKAFCERPFALQRQQLEKDKQNVNIFHPGKIFVDTHGYFYPFSFDVWANQAKLTVVMVFSNHNMNIIYVCW